MAGLSLWLIPSASQMTPLQQIMAFRPTNDGQTLSRHSYPFFLPHITLATVPDSPLFTPEVLRSSLPPPSGKPVRVRFKSLEVGNHYFRSVYLAIRPSTELVAFHDHIFERLQAIGQHEGIIPMSPAFPHMSLSYIDDVDAQKGERVRMADSLQKNGIVTLIPDEELPETKSVELKCQMGIGGKIIGFDGEEVWIVKCVGPVDEWEILQKISLL